MRKEFLRSAERKESEVRSQKSEYGDRTRGFSCFLFAHFVRKALILLPLLLIVSACGGAEHDAALVGSWAYVDIAGWQYEFSGGGTGQRGQHPETQTFSWSTIGGNRLILSFGAEYLNDDSVVLQH